MLFIYLCIISITYVQYITCIKHTYVYNLYLYTCSWHSAYIVLYSNRGLYSIYDITNTYIIIFLRHVSEVYSHLRVGAPALLRGLRRRQADRGLHRGRIPMEHRRGGAVLVDYHQPRDIALCRHRCRVFVVRHGVFPRVRAGICLVAGVCALARLPRKHLYIRSLDHHIILLHDILLYCYSWWHLSYIYYVFKP